MSKTKPSNRGKTERFAKIQEFSNVLHFGASTKGKWNKKVFNNTNPIILELACGKGEYTVEMARRFPDKNFVGIDIKGERIYIGAKQALEENLMNVRFLRTKIEDLAKYFKKNEVSEIWITFPDPFPKMKQMKHRLTAPSFMTMYTNILKPKGLLHLKTDAGHLHHYTIGTMQAADFKIRKMSENIYAQDTLAHPLLDIKTNFENKHLAAGKKIYYVRGENRK